jgi:hypothetical protein
VQESSRLLEGIKRLQRAVRKHLKVKEVVNGMEYKEMEGDEFEWKENYRLLNNALYTGMHL